LTQERRKKKKGLTVFEREHVAMKSSHCIKKLAQHLFSHFHCRKKESLVKKSTAHLQSRGTGIQNSGEVGSRKEQKVESKKIRFVPFFFFLFLLSSSSTNLIAPLQLRLWLIYFFPLQCEERRK